MHDIDVLARTLASLARTAQALPRGLASMPLPIQLLNSDAQLGALIPGVGVRLHTSLRRLGITRPIAGVLDTTLLDRVTDWAGEHAWLAPFAAAACMGLATRAGDLALAPLLAATLTSRDSVISAIGNGRSHIVLWTTGIINVTASSVPIWWFPYHVHAPTGLTLSTSLAATNPTKANSGAINGFLPALSGSEQCVLTAVHELRQAPDISVSRYRAHLLIDLLYECGGISFATNTAQTLGSAALTRYTTGLGVFAVLVTTTSTNNVNMNATVTYTNSAGTESRTATILHPSNLYAAVGGVLPFSDATPFFPMMAMQSGDLGVRSVQSLQWSNTTGTGVHALLLYKALGVLLGAKFSPMLTNDLLTRYQPIVLDNNAFLTMLNRQGADGSFRDVGSTFALRFSHV